MDVQQLRLMLAAASPFKEGDLPVGGTRDDTVRQHAREALGATTLRDLRRSLLVADSVSAVLAESLDIRIQAEIDSVTVQRLADILLSPGGPDWLQRHRDGLSSEAIAAVTKIMTSDDLSRVARGLFNPLPGTGVRVGSPQHFGSRIQPNSPGDNPEEILFSILEGLGYGCGDVIIGLNPASDDVETIVRLEELLRQVVERLDLPTRYCVLSDLPKQHTARTHVPVDVGFQSLAGTSAALRGMVGLDVDGVLDLARTFGGLYFETGQGSAVTNGTAEGVDMVTLESRAYGVARWIGRRTGAWMIVNDVAGFIGPEVFRTPEQLERACLEDAVMAKLHGLTMGLDVCATFHMGISPAALREVTGRIVERAAPAYLMAVAGNADPMLGYLTTSFREHPPLRRRAGRHLTSAMQQRLASLGASTGDAAPPTVNTTANLYAAFVKAGGDRRTVDSLREEGHDTLHELRERGFDLGSADSGGTGHTAAHARVDAIYMHARLALYAALDDGAIGHAAPQHLRVRTLAVDRDDYLAHPARGERLANEGVAAVARLSRTERRPQVQLAISDGLNANAVNEQIGALVPAVRHLLADAGVHVAGTAVVITHGRVRAGYHAAELLDPDVLVHVIGERPGTGINTVSAYLTYGRSLGGTSRWSPALDHSCTTAVCGIHARGKPPAAAAREIAALVGRMLQTRCSGIALGAAP